MFPPSKACALGPPSILCGNICSALSLRLDTFCPSLSVKNFRVPWARSIASINVCLVKLDVKVLMRTRLLKVKLTWSERLRKFSYKTSSYCAPSLVRVGHLLNLSDSPHLAPTGDQSPRAETELSTLFEWILVRETWVSGLGCGEVSAIFYYYFMYTNLEYHPRPLKIMYE